MSHYSLLEIRGSLVDTRVLILGYAMLDRFICGNIGRNAEVGGCVTYILLQ